MKVAVISANLGGFEGPLQHVPQSVACDFFHFNDKNFPPRFNSLTPRLQARVVKIFGWQLVPDYDYYLWVDSSCALSHADSVKWFLEQCQGVDAAVFKHNRRNTIQEEADYLKYRLSINCPYITPRYENELIDEQLAEIQADKSFKDDKLYASTALIYKNNDRVKNMMKDWWYHTSRYHSIDQLSLPYVLYKHGCKVKVIPENYLKIPYLEYVRGKYKHATISFIVPTVGRESVKKTLASIETMPGDEVLVINHDPPPGNWGNAERQEGTDKAKCDYLAFMDDDDVYVPGHRAIMDKAIRENPNGYPILFRMKYPSGRVLWEEKSVKNGNVGSPMILVPNVKRNFHKWAFNRSTSDFIFIKNWAWPAKLTIWREETIALLGHDDEKYEQKLSFAQYEEIRRRRWETK